MTKPQPSEVDVHQAQKAGSFKKIAIPALIVVLVGGWWFYSGKSAPDKNAGHRGMVSAVGTTQVVRKDVNVSLGALGTVTSANTVTVLSRIDGVLQKVYFKEGQDVKAGQLLAELDAQTYQAQLTQAEGTLMKDQALLDNAKLDLARYQQLWAQNSTSKQTLDTQQSLVHQYEGTVKLDKGSVDYYKTELSYTKIYSPVSGRVGLRNVDPGNLVHSSDTTGIVTITQIKPITVVFSVPETQLSQVLEPFNRGQKMAVEAWDRDNHNKLAGGTLLTIDNQLNTSTGTVKLKAEFANDNESLFPNQFVNAKLILGELKQATVIPAAAVQQGNVGTYVYLVNADATVSVRKVQVGPTVGDQTVIQQGLNAGDQVVVDGLDKLHDGSKIKAINRAAQASDLNQAASQGKWQGKSHRAGNASAGASH